MKIWTADKLQRMMVTMFDTDTGYHHSHNTRSNSVQSVSRREADLSTLLRNERVNGPSDRDPTVATKEMIMFKGPYIYIHDIDERQKPIMVREYAKVINKEAGDWPQFRSVAQGKCPFVPEADYSRREAEKEALRQQRKLEQERLEKSIASRTRAAIAADEARMQPPAIGRRALMRTDSNSNAASAVVSAAASNSFSAAQDDESSSRAQPNAYVKRAVAPRLFAGEPVASGLQASNVTSAIRSQMISSTAAAPGAKAGTSKEVHGLQRKVLERNSGPTASGLTQSNKFGDLSLVAKDREAAARLKRKGTPDEMEVEGPVRRDASREVKAIPKKKAVVHRRDPKPGYCENCMDKFDDFEEVRIAPLKSNALH